MGEGEVYRSPVRVDENDPRKIIFALQLKERREHLLRNRNLPLALKEDRKVLPRGSGLEEEDIFPGQCLYFPFIHRFRDQHMPCNPGVTHGTHEIGVYGMDRVLVLVLIKVIPVTKAQIMGCREGAPGPFLLHDDAGSILDNRGRVETEFVRDPAVADAVEAVPYTPVIEFPAGTGNPDPC